MTIEISVQTVRGTWQHPGVSKIVGIDLGTTNSLVAAVDAGIPLVIADPEGQRLTPSVVHFPGPGTEPIVGHAANRVRVLQPVETVYSIKRFIGRRGSEISQEEMLVTYPVRGENAGPVTVGIHGHDFTPEEISAEILKKLMRDAAAFFSGGQDPHRGGGPARRGKHRGALPS